MSIYDTILIIHYAKDLVGDGTGSTFMMKKKANSIKMSTLNPNEVWYMDFGASSHMMNREKWFSHLKKPEQYRVV